MNKQDFKELTGEDPEDMFGGDWENELANYEHPKAGKDCDCIFCINNN